MSILVDLSYINSPQKARESVAIYAFRILDGLSIMKCSNIALLIAEEYQDFFKHQYPSYKLLIYPRLSSFLYRIPYIKGICKLFKWQKYVNRLDVDVIYAPFAWSGNSLSTKAKKVITIHDLRPMRELVGAFTKTWWFKVFHLSTIFLYVSRFFYTQHIKNASKVIAISNYVKEDVCKEWPEYSQKLQTIYNGVVLSEISCCPKELNEHINYILYVNTLSSYKNVETLVRAFEHIKDSCKQQLLIIGKKTDYWIQNETYIRKRGFSNRVIQISYVTDAELKWLYEHASLFVTTSTREGFGYTPIEAALCGCPVISTRAESLPDVTAEKVSYYDPPQSWERLSSLMLSILNSPKDKLSLENIAVFFSNRYDNRKQAYKIYEAIKSISI